MSKFKKTVKVEVLACGERCHRKCRFLCDTGVVSVDWFCMLHDEELEAGPVRCEACRKSEVHQ